MNVYSSPLFNLVTICNQKILEILIFFSSQISSWKEIAYIINHKSRVITKIRQLPNRKPLFQKWFLFLFIMGSKSMFLIQFLSCIWKFVTTMCSYQMYFLSWLHLMMMEVPLFTAHIRPCSSGKMLNEMGWPAMNSAQWKELACNEGQSMKKHSLQWKAVNEMGWPAMKTYWKMQGLLWENLHHNKA